MPADAWRIGVRDLRQARATLVWAAHGQHAVDLYGLEARRMGVGFWRAARDILDRPVIVDCGEHIGTVLAALRVGLDRLFFNVVGAQAAGLDDLVAAHGAQRVRRPPELRLEPGTRVSAQLARLRFQQVTALPLPDKDLWTSLHQRPETGFGTCD